MAKNPTAVAAKWKRNATASLQDYKDGVTNVSVNPMAEAAKNVDKAVQNYQLAAPTMKARLEKGTKESWIKATIDKGGTRYTGGIQASEGKMGDFLSDFLPFQEQVTAQVNAMPSMNLEDNIARMTAQVRKTAEYRNRR